VDIAEKGNTVRKKMRCGLIGGLDQLLVLSYAGVCDTDRTFLRPKLEKSLALKVIRDVLSLCHRPTELSSDV
jgi:hypothetical protein